MTLVSKSPSESVHPNPFKVTVLESVISEADTERHEAFVLTKSTCKVKTCSFNNENIVCSASDTGTARA